MVERQTSRISDGKLVELFSLGDMYMSDFIDNASECVKVPLTMTLDKKSGLLQLKHTAPFDKMYENYWYRSGINKTMTEELKGIARKATSLIKCEDDDIVLDIGCFPLGTKITMSDGATKDICDVVVGDTVISANNNSCRVVLKSSREYSGKMITLHFGKDSITSTEEHPILNYKNQSLKFVPASSISKGEFIVLPRNNNKVGSDSSSLYSLYGWYLAEGTVIYSHKPKVCGINLTLGLNEDSYIEEIENIAVSLGYNVSKSIRPSKNTVDIRIYSKVLADEVVRLFGRGSGSKFILGEVFNHSEVDRVALLRSYFRGDGHLRFVEKACQYYLSTKSQRLQEDVKRMLIQLGAFPNTYEYSGSRHFYAITLCGTDVNVLEDAVGYKSKSKKVVNGNYVIVPVNDITLEIRDCEVYNLTVERDNSYIANNVGVHNCNDGTLLKYYGDNLWTVGFDPAKNMEQYSSEYAGLVVTDYFTAPVYFNKLTRRAKIITAIAMFYDLEDPHKFVEDIDAVLDNEGLWIVQMSYMPLMLQQMAFDNCCHEHLSYYSLSSFEYLIMQHNLKVVDVELNDINGGSFRIYIRKGDSNDDLFATAPYRDVAEFRINSLREYEKKLNLNNPETYTAWFEEIQEIRKQTVDFVKAEKSKGKVIWGYGGSTKGNTLLQWYGLDNTLIDAIAERNPKKYGKRTVGTNIVIKSEAEMRQAKPDYLLVLPWHFISEFRSREREYLNSGGKFIVPLPQFKVISGSKE